MNFISKKMQLNTVTSILEDNNLSNEEDIETTVLTNLRYFDSAKPSLCMPTNDQIRPSVEYSDRCDSIHSQ